MNILTGLFLLVCGSALLWLHWVWQETKIKLGGSVHLGLIFCSLVGVSCGIYIAVVLGRLL